MLPFLFWVGSKLALEDLEEVRSFLRHDRAQGCALESASGPHQVEPCARPLCPP